MATLTCIICGVEFEGITHARKTCPDCLLNCGRSVYQEDKRKDKHNPNQRLIDDANRETELGLSYGVYMGGTYAHKRL
jgi:hypothetical protein